MIHNENAIPRTKMRIDESIEGETIEQKMRRIITTNEPIKDGAPLIYTERNEGVLAGYDIRTDRWEVAIDAKDYITKTKLAEREDRHKTSEQKEAERLAKEAKEGMKKEGTNDPKEN